jgi:uncharacterized protein (TIGR02301 family)
MTVRKTSRKLRRSVSFAAAILFAFAVSPDRPSEAAPKAHKSKAKHPQIVAPPPPQTPAEAPPPPYEPQMLRLSEVLGALSFLSDLCASGDGDDWREKMSSLLQAETPGPQRQKLTASFNRGFRGYELTYRSCTANAKIAMERYLDESSRLARDISYRYGNP